MTNKWFTSYYLDHNVSLETTEEVMDSCNMAVFLYSLTADMKSDSQQFRICTTITHKKDTLYITNKT